MWQEEKSEFAVEAHCQVSCSGVTITALPNSHQRGNMSFVNDNVCKILLPGSPLSFDLNIHSLKMDKIALWEKRSNSRKVLVNRIL